jgi:hypothetical protein
MKRNEKRTIEISPKNIEDLIWMSYRYCIGRKTIAASMHAGTIADIIFKNPNLLNKDRIEFMVQDIRQCILDAFKWNNRIRFENNYYLNHDWDFYSLLLEGMSKCPYPAEARYIIDMEKRTLSWEKGEHNVANSNGKVDVMYDDLIGWVKLANALDETCHKDITVNVEGEDRVIRCFPYVAYTQGEYKQVWASIEHDANSNITLQGYIIPEKIKKIENI